LSTGSFRRRSAEDVIDELRDLVAFNATQSVELAARMNEFVQDLSRQAARGQPLPPSELLSRWLNFNLASYALVSKQSFAFLDGLLTIARNTLVPESGPAPVEAAPDAPLMLQLAGRHGDRVATGFVIENHFDQPLEVSFECDDLTSPLGKPLPSSVVTFEPPTLNVPARGQGIGRVAADISNEFVVGETYTTTIRLLGFQGKELGLAVVVLPGIEETRTSRQRAEEAKKAPRSPGPASGRRAPHT
jgi:hypothetical protein